METPDQIDPEIGFAREECLAAADRLQPVIQRMVSVQTDPALVLTALGEAFYGCLQVAGASAWQIEKWNKRIYGKIGIKSNFGASVQGAYEPLGAEITAMVDEGAAPLVIAWSLVGAIINITGQLLGQHSPRIAWLQDNLIMHINEVRDRANA
jgi:hypothetical protein